MPASRVTLDFGNVLSDAIGALHGLSAAEIKRLEPTVADAIKRVEAERAGGLHRYRALPRDKAMLAAVKSAVRGKPKKFENLVVLGIGGSALGNIALQTALSSPFYNLLPPAARGGPRLFVMDNVDPVQFGELLKVLKPTLKKTLFNVISKSGETAETGAQMLIVRDLLAKAVGKNALRKQMLITTDARSGAMREFASAGGYDTLPVPDGVGGRWSVLSAVGLFSAAMCGIRIEPLLAGAAEMGERVASTKVRQNPAAMLALLMHAFYVRGKRLHVMFPYSYQLSDLSDWWRQLWAESLGKSQDLDGRPTVIGPTPVNALGSTDQHSQVQLYREGPNDKVFIFLEVEKFAADVKIPPDRTLPDAFKYLCGSSLGKLLNAEKSATEYALVNSQRPCLTIRFPSVNESTVGQFIMLWEAATTLTGALLNVNAYDQPAVQLGKDMTFALMGKRGYEKQALEYKKYVAKRGKDVI